MVEVDGWKTKTADNQPDFRVTSEGALLGAKWVRRSQSSSNNYASLSLAAPKFCSRKLDANLGRAVGGRRQTRTLNVRRPARGPPTRSQRPGNNPSILSAAVT